MRYAGIDDFEISNGSGSGVSLYVQGCRFHCHNCFNTETWDFTAGKPWTEEIEKDFFELAAKPYIKRISILGGEPLANENVSDVLQLVHKIKDKFPEKAVWLFTGYTMETIYQCNLYKNNIRKQVIELCDIVVDGQFVESKKDLSLQFRGSSNQRIIDIKKSLEKEEIILWTT